MFSTARVDDSLGFFLLALVTPYASADTKIGLDPERRPIKTWTDPVTRMAFVWVPGGCYQMGCGSWAGNCDSDEEPVHTAPTGAEKVNRHMDGHLGG